MPASRTARKPATERACLECQKRKTKCVAAPEGDACAYCLKAGKTCVFEGPHERTSLTRRNLDVAEARCRELEVLLEQLQANTNAGAEQSRPSQRPEAHPEPRRVHNPEDPPSGPYEWNEGLDSGANDPSPDGEYTRDGMASLTRQGNGSGYLGKSSGFQILQSVSSLLPSQVTAADRVEGLDPAVSPSIANPQLFATMQSHSLTTSSIQDQLITAFFLGYNAYYPILHEGTFRKQYASRKQMSPRSTWHITYYMVLAIGEWVSGYSNEENSIYYEAARSRIRPEVLESGSLNNVQAFLLLGNYLQKRDRPNTGYNYIGIALRMALGLALHLELPPSAGVEPFDTHRRRVLFWILCCFDCWFNITTGRPTLIPDNFVDIRVPSNVDESAHDTTSTTLSEVSYPTTSSTVIALARLTKIANRVFTQFMCVNPCADIDHQTSVMEHMIHNWHTSLPAYFFDANVPSWFLGPRQIVLWKESNLLILLLLSSQRHHKDEHEKLSLGTRCQSVSANVISGIATFCQSYAQILHCGLSWYAVYFTLQATLSYSAQYIFKARLSVQSQDDFQDHEAIIGQACQCLQGLLVTSSAAARSLQIVLRLREMLRQTAGERAPSAGGELATRHDQQTNYSGIIENSDHRHELSIQMAQGFQDGIFQPSPSNAGSYQPFDNHGIAELVLNEWSLAADPSLQALFDNMNDFGHPFQITE
ncbi:hypothetical protein E4T47_08038 [Aureobasidium subglaciale]|nr:hypothetical protein E4T47_08038 [Aureobasidium subglaciale]